MDVNATLAELRELVEAAHETENGYQDSCEFVTLDSVLCSLIEMADRVEALDGWLTRQGMLPEDWAL